jgi:RHS repeat-associated protein
MRGMHKITLRIYMQIYLNPSLLKLLRHACFALFALASLALAPSAYAAPDDCMEKSADGEAICQEPFVSPYVYTMCEEIAPFASRYGAYCRAFSDGMPVPCSDGYGLCCPNGNRYAVNEYNTLQRAQTLAMLLGYVNKPSSQTGWATPGHSANSTHCVHDHLPTTFAGVETSSWRRIDGGDLKVFVTRNRQMYCPADYTLRVGSDGKPECFAIPCYECDAELGNPINFLTGEKTQTESDFVGTGYAGLALVRRYSSFGEFRPLGVPASPAQGFGHAWRTQYHARIYPLTGVNVLAARIGARRKVEVFDLQGNRRTNTGGYPARLTRQPDGTWRYVDESDTVETYDSQGRLVQIRARSGYTQTLTYIAMGLGAGQVDRVTDSYGKSLVFEYANVGVDGAVLVSAITDPAGNRYVYQWDGGTLNLKSVTYPDSNIRRYTYESNLDGRTYEWLLTGIVDENGVAYADFKYVYYGFAYLTQHIGGVNRFEYLYAYGGLQVNDPYVGPGLSGVATNFGWSRVAGAKRSTGKSRRCASCSSSASRAYAANGNLASRTDFNGLVTGFSYEPASNLPTQRVEAKGTALERTTNTAWHGTYKLPTRVTEPQRETLTSYDASGNPLSRTLRDLATTTTRVTGYSGYDALGRPATINGPRTDVSDTTSYTYYPNDDAQGNKRGQLASMTNAAGHTTQYTSYDANGRLLSMTDPNGLVTSTTYHARGWVLSRTVGTETTTYTYDNLGQLLRTTRPDGSFVDYTYDPAHRLVGTKDGLGDRVVYTLDNAGNRIREDVYDATGTLTQQRLNSFTTSGEVAATPVTTSPGKLTSYAYDSMGNRTSVTDPLGRITSFNYDALHRLTQVTDAATPINGATRYTYDNQDNLTSVTDPLGRVTSYTYNGFGEVTRELGPATGSTSYTYDPAGNLKTRIDARGVTSTYTYDALNRVTSVVHSKSGSASETITYIYDDPLVANSRGRLTKVTDTAGTTQYTYDSLGRITSKAQTVAGITKTLTYSYNTAGQLASMTLPSGHIVSYGYTNNRINAITLNPSSPVNLIQSTSYEPFAGLNGWLWGNGLKSYRDFDLDGRIQSTEFRNGTTLLKKTLSYDAASRITSIADLINQSASQAYTHDSLDRLTQTQQGVINSSSNPPVVSTPDIVQSFTYDANGNRLSSSQTHPTSSSTSNAPTNGLNVVAGDYGYNLANRLKDMKQGATTIASYRFNAMGHRIAKTIGEGATPTHHYVYDEAGQLVGEYDATGKLVQEVVWLGNTPVATLRPQAGSTATPVAIDVYYIHTDHLNTPRVITRPSDNKRVWEWRSLPFGEAMPNESPEGLPAFTSHLRFPGQEWEAELGLSQNWFRTYDGPTGRYVQSDPIGLGGGLNTYAYVKGNPLKWVDPDGLRVQRCCRAASIAFGLVDHCWIKTDTVTAGMNNAPQCSRAGDGGSDLPFSKVYVSDHTCDRADACTDMPDVDEECVNKELAVGRTLGRFTPTNNCQTFALTVFAKCSKYKGPWNNRNNPNFPTIPPLPTWR